MTEGHLITALNDSPAPWVVSYRLDATAYSVTVPEGEALQLIATHYESGSEWIEVQKPLHLSARSGLADSGPDVIGAITILFGAICGLAFWSQANPFRK